MIRFLKNNVLLKVVLCFLTVSVLQVNAATVNEIKQEIIKQSNEMGVDPAVMLSIAKTESGFRQEAIGA